MKYMKISILQPAFYFKGFLGLFLILEECGTGILDEIVEPQ